MGSGAVCDDLFYCIYTAIYNWNSSKFHVDSMETTCPMLYPRLRMDAKHECPQCSSLM